MALACPDHLCEETLVPVRSWELGCSRSFGGVIVQPMWGVCIGIGTRVRISPILLKGNRLQRFSDWFVVLELSVWPPGLLLGSLSLLWFCLTLFKKSSSSQAWWLTPVVPTTRE